MGESSCVSLFKSGKFHFLCCDDIEAINKLSYEVGSKNILMTFDVIKILVDRGMVKTGTVKNIIAKLFRLRKWKLSNSMVKLAKERGLI